jgi:hypothetical protein
MGTIPRILAAFTVAAIILACSTGSAPALEPGAHPPFLPGSTGGVPIGLLPPPALYVSSLTTYIDGFFHADSRPRHPRALYSFSEGVSILWVPDVMPLGARYGFFAQQAVVDKTVTGIPPRGVSSSERGLNNTFVAPLSLAWMLPSNFFASARFGFHLPNGQYDRHNLVNIANNFWAFEPSVGITYVRDGLDLSLRLVYDTMTENTSSNAPGNVNGRYQSGNIFSADYTASQGFGKWRLGVTGSGVQQTNDDSAAGRTLHGTKVSKVGIGPLLQYNASRIGLNVHYVRDMAWSGGFGGHNYYFRVTVKF